MPHEESDEVGYEGVIIQQAIFAQALCKLLRAVGNLIRWEGSDQIAADENLVDRLDDRDAALLIREFGWQHDA